MSVGSPASGTPAIGVRHLWKVFGSGADGVVGTPLAELPRDELLAQTGCTAAVRDVSFDVAEGEVFVVMGLSGSGKSTLVRCLTRLIEPTAGEVLIEGQDLLRASAAELRQLRRTRFSMVFQHFGLLPHRRVVDNIAYPLEIQGVKKDERHARAREVIDLVGLSAIGEKLIKAYDLNYKIINTGSEAALIEAFTKGNDEKTAVLGYFYEPQNFLAKVPLCRINFPASDWTDPAEASGLTDYPETPLIKLATTKLADSDSPFATLVKNFNWTNADQNQVALDIESGMTPEEAAQKWIDANPDTVSTWLERTGAS